MDFRKTEESYPTERAEAIEHAKQSGARWLVFSIDRFVFGMEHHDDDSGFDFKPCPTEKDVDSFIADHEESMYTLESVIDLMADHDNPPDISIQDWKRGVRFYVRALVH